MDPLTIQYATLVTNLGLAGFMAVMYTRFFIAAANQRDSEAKERKAEAEQRTADAKMENNKCLPCMEGAPIGSLIFLPH